MEFSWDFVSAIRIFFNIRIHFAEFIFVTCVFFSLIFDYWWLHVPGSSDLLN